VIRKTLIPFAALALAACATTDPPEREKVLVGLHEGHGLEPAAQEAPQQLADAQAKLSRAETAMQRGHYEHARILAEEAEADAKLAWTVAENARVQRNVAEVQDANRALREELERTTQ